MKKIPADTEFKTALLRSAIEAAPDGILIVDKNGIITAANKKFVELWNAAGISLEANESAKLFEHLAARVKDSSLFIEKIIGLTAHENSETSEALQLIDGRTFEWFSSPQKLEDEIIGRVHGFRNITSRKEAEDVAAYQRNLMNMLLDNSPDQIYFKDTGSRFIMVNKATAKRFGFENPEEAIGKSDFDFFTEEHARPAFDAEQRIIKTGKPLVNIVEKETWADGTETWASTTKLPLIDAGGAIVGTVGISRDITARKHAEEALRKFQYGIKHTSEAIFITNVDGTINFVNPAFEKIYGFTSEEAVGKTPRIIKSGVLSEEIYQDFWNKLLNKQNVSGEIINKTKDGRLITIEGVNNPILNDAGNIIGFMGIHRDITERKHIEQELEASEKKYKELFERSDDANLIISNGKFIDCNEAAVKMLRYKNKKELLDTHPSELSPPLQPDGRASYEKANEMMNTALKIGSHRFEWNHKKADGEIFPVEVLLTAIVTGGENKIIHTVWRDVTQQKKSQLLHQALYEISESAHRALDMGMLYKKIHEVIGTLMPVKNIYIALYDEKTELLSFPYMVDEYDSAYEPKKLGAGLTEYILRKGDAYLIDAQMDFDLRALGETELIGTPAAIWLGVPLKIDAKTIGVIVVQDYENEKAFGEDEKQLLIFVSEQIAQVIERKRKEHEIKQYADELKQTNQTKDKLFSIIAHDLRSPFQPLLAFSEILSTELEFLEKDEIKNFAGDIHKVAQSVLILIDNLLEWSRMQSGTIQFKPVTLNLKQKSDEVIVPLSENAHSKNISLKNMIMESQTVSADDQMLRSILHNLLSNAIKFTKEGGEIVVGAKNKNDFCEISIADNGVGIPPEQVNRIFTSEQNISTKGTNQERGTGLGLLLCKEFVEKHGGKIRVESVLGEGSKFIFTLPNESLR